MPEPTTMTALLGRYECLWLDSFGVLVDGAGALPGARELVVALTGRDFLVVTNDASRLPSTTEHRYRALGLPIPRDRVLTSGMLLAPYFAEHALDGATCLVLGTDDSREYVRRAGGEIADIDPDVDYDAVIVADDDGFDFFPGVDAALSAIIRRTEAGRPPALVLPNPDLIYPKAPGQFGFTAGGVALLLEAGLERRLGTEAPRFVHLGKPHRAMFAEAQRRSPSPAVMVGDQLQTDIAGAAAVGVDTALLQTGITRAHGDGDVQPTYVLSSLWP